jgi:hypothetical protein
MSLGSLSSRRGVEAERQQKLSDRQVLVATNSAPALIDGWSTQYPSAEPICGLTSITMANTRYSSTM